MPLLYYPCTPQIPRCTPLVERALSTEMDVHLDDPKYKTEGKAKRDRRNGHSQKTLKGEFGEAVIDIPRDRNGEFEPIIVKKGQTRFEGLSYPVPYGGKPSFRAVR